LFEADCVTSIGQPDIGVQVTGPQWVPDPTITYVITYSNSGAGVAHDATLLAHLDSGMHLVSADGNPSEQNGTVTWDLANLAPRASWTVNITVGLDAAGTYDFSASLTYRMGQNRRQADSNQVTTRFGGPPPDGDAGIGAGDATSDGTGPSSGSGTSGCSCRNQPGGSAGLPLFLLMLLWASMLARRRRSTGALNHDCTKHDDR